ncbi:MAG: acyltransferase family protein [Clostridia bacterium]|nr:acyltransferase family protein [Clostridia bacterium]
MRTKKEIMGLAGLMVLLFHFYIPFGNSPLETYLFRSTFVGVDLFFFVSAYSLGSRNKNGDINVGKFLLNRLGLIYIPFFILSGIAAIYGKWDFIRFSKVVSTIEFFERGGGAFLWYLTGICFLYLFVPLMLKIKKRFGLSGLLILLCIWALLSIILQYGFNYTKLFILINRLPIFIIGLYFDDLGSIVRGKIKKNFLYVLEAALFIAGSLIVFFFGVTSRLNKPFADMYYVIAIPLILAIALIINSIFTRSKSRILKFIGGITLELYGLQMIFGYNLEIKLMKFMPVKQLAVIPTGLLLILMAFALNKLLNFIREPIRRKTL